MQASAPISIDGSVRSGSGTIVRYSLSLASILRNVLYINNIRAKREKPGLRNQHLKCVEACCELTGGLTEKATLGSREIKFVPGKEIQGGDFRWDIGTAGSTTMLALCLLPLGCFATKNSHYTISGGLFQDFAPNPFHTKYVLLNLLKTMSVKANIKMVKPGYVPTGQGIIDIEIESLTGSLKPLSLPEQGRIQEIRGVALSSHLSERGVSRRMAEACKQVLAKAGYSAEIEILDDTAASQKGAALCIYAATDKGCIIGADIAGKLGRTSEEIGKRAAYNLLSDIRSNATVDRYAADQLILYAAIASGKSEYIIPEMNEHIESNLWLIEVMAGAKVKLEERHLEIEGIGLEKK